MGVEGRAWLGVGCMGVFMVFILGVPAYIRRLFLVFESPVSVRLEQGSGY